MKILQIYYKLKSPINKKNNLKLHIVGKKIIYKIYALNKLKFFIKKSLHGQDDFYS